MLGFGCKQQGSAGLGDGPVRRGCQEEQIMPPIDSPTEGCCVRRGAGKQEGRQVLVGLHGTSPEWQTHAYRAIVVELPITAPSLRDWSGGESHDSGWPIRLLPWDFKMWSQGRSIPFSWAAKL